MLPKSTFSEKLIRHLMLYYDRRFEKNQQFINLLFNQKQRHEAVRKISTADTTNKKVLIKLSKLIESDNFKSVLNDMISNPNSKKSKTLNSKLVKILSVFGKTVPFSPIERAQTRIRFSSIAMRFGTLSHFVTIAPPEQDDLALLKLHLIRDNNNFNNKNTSTFNNTSNYK